MSELGSRLRMAREEKGISLDQLQTMTKIQKKYLSGIEEGNYSQIPGKFYVRAFIKQYAEAVGLPPDEFLEEFKSEIPTAYEDDLSEQLSRVQTRRTVSPRSSKIIELLPKILIGIVIVAALFLIWYLFSKNGDTAEQPAKNGDNPIVDIEESGEVQSPEPAPKKDKKNTETKDKKSKNNGKTESAKSKLTMENVSGNETTYKLTGAETVKLKVSAADSGETWLKVQDGNNQVLFQGMLQDGQNQEFDLSEETEVLITAGRTSDTDIFINGEQLEYELDPAQQVLQEIRIQFDKQ